MRDDDFSRRQFVVLSGATAIAGGGLALGARSGLLMFGYPRITISAFSVSEQSLPGSTVGVLSVFAGNGTYTFSIPPGGDPDGKFALDGANLITANTFDFESATFHRLTLKADNGVDPILSRTLLISVTNAFEQPDLSSLLLPGTVTQGSIVAITGATAGSTITAVSLPNGWTLDGENRQILIANDATLNQQSWSLMETLRDSSNSPNISNGSSSVEVPSITRFDPVAQGFVMFDSRDIAGDGSVSSWQSKDGRNTVSNAIAAERPRKGSGVVSFDGSNDILTDAVRSFGAPRASYDLDAVWNASPLGDTEQFTNTGITRAPDGSWWVVNHPAGAPSRSDGILVHFNSDFSGILDTIDTGAVFGVGTIGGPQGIVYDTDTNTLWFTSSLANEIKHVTLGGTAINDAIPFPNPAGLAIDQANGTLIILESEGSASNKNAGVMRTVSKSTGATVASGSLTDLPDWDQIYFDQESRALFITAGYEYASSGDTFVGIYSMDGAGFLTRIGRIREPTATAIEGIVYHAGKLYICNDSGFHGGIGSGLNEVLEYDVGQIVGNKLVFAAALRVLGYNSGSDVLFGLGEPIGSGEYGFNVMSQNPTNLQLFARSAPSKRTNTDFATGTVDLTSQTRIITGVFDPGAASDARIWIDGTELSGTVTGGANNSFTGPIVDRVPLAVAGVLRDGVKQRQANIDVSAIGYALINAGAGDQRQEIEGWLAHEFGLTGALPGDHPFKTIAPSG